MEAGIRIYDILLVVALVGAAWQALFGREAFASTVFFIAYGLLIAMAWAQLGATDVALAEACISAGLTGALLINAIRQFERDPGIDSPSPGGWKHFMLGGLSLVVFSGLLGAVSVLQEPVHAVFPLVRERLAISGSSHPVTAVLLNFRSLDTGLELGVLLVACLSAISIHRIYDELLIPSEVRSEQDQPQRISRIMLPMLLLVGGILLWFGTRAPGGAFQAGALIGAAGILLQIGGQRSLLRFKALRFRFALALGFLSFLAVAFLAHARGGQMLELPPGIAGRVILFLELAATVSIALTLNVMYACSRPWNRRAP